MDREAEYDAKQREASLAGLYAGILLLFLVGAGLVVLFSLLPT